LSEAVRDFKSGLPKDVLDNIQRGTLRYTYRGLPMLKDPFDLAIYLQLIGRLRPRTVIEVGSAAGGSAMWFADMLTAHGIEGEVVSVDRKPPQLADARVRFLRGDAIDLRASLQPDFFASLRHPLLVTEDSAHTLETTLAVLRFFDPYLAIGDYLVVEDGIVAQRLSGSGWGEQREAPRDLRRGGAISAGATQDLE
jgi:cephalosporin hydroxylase